MTAKTNLLRIAQYLLFVKLTLLTTIAFAQQAKKPTQDSTNQPTMVVIETKDGNIFHGFITETRKDTIVLTSKTWGAMAIPLKSIINIRQDNGEVPRKDGWFENYNASRYFFSSSGIGMRKGEGYYQNFYLFLHNFNYAFSDYFSVSGGFEGLSLVIASYPKVYWAVPKVTFPVAKSFYIGGGALFAGVIGIGENVSGTVGFVNGTYGNRDNNVSVGYGFVPGNSNGGLIIVGGQVRIARRWSLVGDSFIISRSNSSASGNYFVYGARYMGSSISLDMGFLGAYFQDTNNSTIGGAVIYGSLMIPFGLKHR